MGKLRIPLLLLCPVFLASACERSDGLGSEASLSADFRAATPDADEPISDEDLQAIKALLPEQQSAPDNQPQLFEGFVPGMSALEDTDVWVTFVHEGAGYKNAFGYFTYPSDAPPDEPLPVEELEEGLIFSNASALFSGGKLYNGRRMYLGVLPEGHSIGFYLVAGGYCTQGEGCDLEHNVNFNRATYYTIDALNPESTQSKRRHVVQAYFGEEGNGSYSRLLAWEDLNRDSGSSDDDFNDLVFKVVSNPDLATDPDEPNVDPEVDDGGCGDGVLDEDEQCDDGNVEGEDGCSAECNLEPLSFNWATSYADAQGWNSGGEYWATIRFPDLDGDGRDDVCGRASEGLFCGLSDGTTFEPTSYWSSNFSNAQGWQSAPYHWDTIEFPDLNGDGRDDVCGRASTGVYCALSDGASFEPWSQWTPSYSNALGWHTAAYHWDTIEYHDVSGDGRADVCGRAAQGIYCAVSNGEGFEPWSQWTSNFGDAQGWQSNPSHWGTIQYDDLNGDGRVDICGRAASGIMCALSSGDAFSPWSQWTTSFSNAAGWNASESYWGTIQLTDLNGDDRADICGRGGEGVYCALSDGGSFEGLNQWTPNFNNVQGWGGQEFYWGTISFTDLDGDSLDDICGRGGEGIFCARSNGASFEPWSAWTSNYGNDNSWQSEPYYWATIQFPDPTGDGRADVCGRGAEGIFCAISTGDGFIP